MSLPKWVTKCLASEGRKKIAAAERLRQKHANHPKRERDLSFGIAQHWEQKGKRLIEISETGTDHEKQEALSKL